MINIGKLKPGKNFHLIMTGTFTTIDFQPWNDIVARERKRENSPLGCPGCISSLERMYKLEYKKDG